MPDVSGNRPPLIFVRETAPSASLVRVFVAAVVVCWFLQAAVIAADHWWPESMPRPVVGILLFPAVLVIEPVMPVFSWLFSGVSEKAHWPIIALFSLAFSCTSVVYGLIITSVVRWWMVADDGHGPTLPSCVATVTTSTSPRC